MPVVFCPLRSVMTANVPSSRRSSTRQLQASVSPVVRLLAEHMTDPSLLLFSEQRCASALRPRWRRAAGFTQQCALHQVFHRRSPHLEKLLVFI